MEKEGDTMSDRDVRLEDLRENLKAQDSRYAEYRRALEKGEALDPALKKYGEDCEKRLAEDSARLQKRGETEA